LFWRVVFGVILTWLYNRTNGSLLAPVLFHPVMNAFGNAFFGTAMSKVLCIALDRCDRIRPDVGETALWPPGGLSGFGVG